MQQIGETTSAIMADTEKEIERIVRDNSHRTDPYWIIMFAKRLPFLVDGKYAFKRVIKPIFKERPKSMIGLIIAEVNNQKGSVEWEINHHDIPFDYAKLGLEEGEPEVVQTRLAPTYIYN